MNINIKRFVDYEVKCFEGVKIKLKNLSTSDMAKSYEIVKDNKKETKIKWDMDFIFKTMIIDVIGLTVTDEKNKVVEIKTAEDILYNNPGVEELYLELAAVLMSMTARVDAKN